MDPLHKLAEYFREFPGIGPRQAKRFVYFLLTRNSSELEDISRLITEIKKSVRICSLCYRFYPDGKSTVCPVCADPNRDASQLMIVSRDVDFEAIEKSKVYHGYYFVLGGIIPILEKEPEKRVRLKELQARISKGQFKEVILSLNANAEGEHTADFIRDYIAQNFANKNIKVSVLGRGLSTGTELEYADGETIKSALKNRG
jgi:recombination protein RecR